MTNIDERLQNLEKEVEKLKLQVESLQGKNDNENCNKKQEDMLRKMPVMSNYERVVERAKFLLNDEQGLMYAGVFKNKETQSNFASYQSVDDVLKVDSFDGEKFFGVLASQNRIDILKLLMKDSATAEEIMEQCNFETTGKFYHHINFLLNANFIKKAPNSKYYIDSRSVQYILIMFLCVYLDSSSKNYR